MVYFSCTLDKEGVYYSHTKATPQHDKTKQIRGGNKMAYKKFKSSGVTFNEVNKIPTKVRNTILKAVNTFIQEEQRWEQLDNILQFIAGGACGRVYDLGDYILKVNRSNGLAESCKDGQILADLQGLHFIPKLYWYSEDNRFMVVQKIDGQTTGDFRLSPDFLPKNDFKVDRQRWEEVMEKVYEEAKERGWVMNDIHSQNTMFDKDGRFWIVDVGLFRETGYWGGDLRDLQWQWDDIMEGMDKARNRYAVAI
jgi:hypothetical protein